MPFKNTSQLPASVKNVLPEDAQEIFVAAYNKSWQQYPMFGERQGRSPREDTAMKVAWSAVKKEYKQNEETGQWEKK